MATLGQRQERFTRDIANLFGFAFSNGLEVRCGEFQRTPEQQAIYLKTGRSKTTASKHLDKLAADLFFTQDGRLMETKADLQFLGDYWEKLTPGNKWGGNFPKWYPGSTFTDCPHFEAG